MSNALQGPGVALRLPPTLQRSREEASSLLLSKAELEAASVSMQLGMVRHAMALALLQRFVQCSHLPNLPPARRPAFLSLSLEGNTTPIAIRVSRWWGFIVWHGRTPHQLHRQVEICDGPPRYLVAGTNFSACPLATLMAEWCECVTIQPS